MFDVFSVVAVNELFELLYAAGQGQRRKCVWVRLVLLTESTAIRVFDHFSRISAGFDAGDHDAGCSKYFSDNGMDLAPADFRWVTEQLQASYSRDPGDTEGLFEDIQEDWVGIAYDPAKADPTTPGADWNPDYVFDVELSEGLPSAFSSASDAPPSD